MKKLLALLIVCGMLFSSTAFAEYVSGHYRKNGTYVNGYNRSSANNTVRDNYSYAGNTNPYTGAVGTNYYRNDPSSGYYNNGGSEGYFNALNGGSSRGDTFSPFNDNN